jgi:putative ABC transport system permease protein
MVRLFDILLYTLERIWLYKQLVLWVLIGLVTAVTFTLSLPLYVDAVYSDLLTTQLPNPPYAFRIRYLGSWNGTIAQTDVAAADRAIRAGFVTQIGYPLQRQTQFVRVGTYNRTLENDLTLGPADVGMLSGADDQMTISAGVWADDVTRSDGIIPVLIPDAMFYQHGLDVGDRLTLRGTNNTSVEAEIVARWHPTNPDDPAWIFPPRFFDTIMIVPESTAWIMVGDTPKPVTEAAWYLVFEDGEVRTADIDSLLAQIVNQTRRLETVLPGVRFETPETNLRAFNQAVQQFTLQLAVMIAPVGGLVLYFVGLVAGLLVQRQAPEDVKLNSRGMSRRGLLLIHLLMWIMMVAVAFGISLLLAPLVVRLVGQTTSFLRFDRTELALDIRLIAPALLAAFATSVVAASSGLFLAWRSIGQNVNSLRQNEARVTVAWWQRTYLDVLLLIPAAYILVTLRQQGGLVASADRPFSDPLVFVGPTLFALGLTLLFLRVFPFVLSRLAQMVALTRSIALLMALRELTRSSQRYRGTLLMTAFTLSLITFTASLASTLDRSLHDTIQYQVGADLVLVTAIDALVEQQGDDAQSLVVTGFNAPPVEQLTRLPGITDVARVGRYRARLQVGSRSIATGEVLGVDRWSLANVATFRADYADRPLSELMNHLAVERTGILLDRATAMQYGLALGQALTLEVQALNVWYAMQVRVVDVVDYFPTITPSANGFFAITNLTPIFETVGTPLPFNVWLGLQPGINRMALQTTIREQGFPVISYRDSEAALRLAQADAGRRGVFGFLSVGFIASVLLTLIAVGVQNAATYRVQARQLGMLQSLGLSRAASYRCLLLLQILPSGSSLLSGAAIGAGMTLLYLPLLDFSAGAPPYLVRLAWDDILPVVLGFGGAFALLTWLSALLLGRQQLISILRLGESA